MDPELIIADINENREEYISFLAELIKTDSYNPPGNEMNVAKKIEEFLNKAEVACEVFPIGENRANLYASLNDNTKGKNLLYNGHMDIVPPGNEEEWTHPPLSAYIKRKKIMFGRGTTDMKGGLAGMVIALVVLKKLGFETSGNLLLNAVCDEETGGKYGVGWLLENKMKSIKCDFTIVGEPSGLAPLPKAVILGEKGHLQLRIIANGISCHSSTPFLGENAIYMISNIIQNLYKLEEYIPAVDPPLSEKEIKDLIAAVFPNKEIFNRILIEQPLLQNVIKSLTQFTYSLNMIEGGIKENIIPDRCEAIMDFRLLPGQSSDIVIDALKKLITELGYNIRDKPAGAPEDVFIYIDAFNQNEASYWSDWEQSEDLPKLHSVIEKVYKKKPFNFLFPACSDAVWYRNSGFCPSTVLFGPGSAVTAHATNESIEIQDFIDSTKVYALFAAEYLK